MPELDTDYIARLVADGMLAIHEKNLKIAATHAIMDFLGANPDMKYSPGAVVRAVPLHLKAAAQQPTWNDHPTSWSVERDGLQSWLSRS